jgi:hypothetical protein
VDENDYKSLSPEMIDACDLYSKCILAQDPNISIEVILRITENSYKTENSHKLVRQFLAKNPSTPKEVKIWLNGGYAGLTLSEFLERLSHE